MSRLPGQRARGVLAVVLIVLGYLTVAPGMMVGGPAALLTGLVMVAAGIALMPRRTSERGRSSRTYRALTAWAQAEGWRYAVQDQALTTRWHGAPFDAGGAYRTIDVLSREAEGRLTCSCTVRRSLEGITRPTRTYVHLVGLQTPARLPDLRLRPHVEDEPRDLRAQDVVTESPAFNAEWRVQGSDLRAVHGVLHPATLERLMADDLRGANLRTEGDWLLVWWPGPTDPDLVGQRVAAVLDLERRIPRHVWQDQGWDPIRHRPAPADRYDPMTAGPTEEQL